MKFKVVDPTICEDEKPGKAVQADMPLAVSTGRSTESADGQLNAQPETSKAVSNPSTTSTSDQPPSSPLMDLESDFPSGEISNYLI